jgi:hypothetical protein
MPPRRCPKPGVLQRVERAALTCLLVASLAPGPHAGQAIAQAPSPAEQQQRIDQKMTQAIDLLPGWVRGGGDFWTIIELEHKVSESVKARDFAGADRTADQILAMLEKPALSRPKTAIAPNAFEGLQEQIDNWIAAGGNPADVFPLGEQLSKLLQTGPPEAIAAQIARIKAVIATKPSNGAALRGQEAAALLPVDVRRIPADAAIVFHSTRSHRGPEIYTLSASGEATQITFLNPQPYDQPYEHVAVSYDRRYIAANRYLRGGAGPTGVWVIDLEQKTERRLLSGFFSAGNGGVDWSADGFLYFAARRTPAEKEGVFRIRPDGSGLKALITLDPSDPGLVGDVSVSEDSTMLAYVRAVAVRTPAAPVLKTQVWVSAIDGTGQRMVDDGGPELGTEGGFPIGDFDPEISPDNTFVVFSRTNTGHVNFPSSFNTAHDIWIAPLEGSVPARRVTRPGPISIVPDWHGNQIIYTEISEADNTFGLVVINPDGTSYRRLEPSLRTLLDCGQAGKWIPNAPALSVSR